MTRPAAIWADEDRGLEVRIEDALSDEVVSFLTGTVWGSRDLRYRIPDLGGRLAGLRAPTVFVMERDRMLVSVCILDRCRKRILGREVDTFHVVMIATREDDRDTGLGGQLLQLVRQFCDRELERPGMAFAYVEKTTVFTLQMSDRVGHALEAEMPLLLFSRLWPSDDPRVGWARTSERAGIVERLNRLYADHELTDFEASLNTDRYLVLREAGRIVAGLQVEKLIWTLVSLPGHSGRLVMRAMPWIPFTRGRLDPDRLPLLRFGNLLVEPGQGAAAMVLMNAALARENASLAMTLLDRRSAVLATIRENGSFGLLSKAVNGAVQVHLDVWGMTDEEVAELGSRPLLPGAADIF